jgi:hypothetical protein
MRAAGGGAAAPAGAATAEQRRRHAPSGYGLQELAGHAALDPQEVVEEGPAGWAPGQLVRLPKLRHLRLLVVTELWLLSVAGPCGLLSTERLEVPWRFQ